MQSLYMKSFCLQLQQLLLVHARVAKPMHISPQQKQDKLQLTDCNNKAVAQV